MKAILIIGEMPETCWGCPCLNERFRICGATGEDMKDGEKTDMRCPLKPMPKRSRPQDVGEVVDLYRAGLYAGWNACLEEIEGETE